MHRVTKCKSLSLSFRQAYVLSNVSSVTVTRFYWICQLRRVRRCLGIDSMKTLVHAFIMSQVYCCNTIFAGSPHHITDMLQHVLNVAAGLVTCTCKYNHVLTHLLHDELHWLFWRQCSTSLQFWCARVCRTVHRDTWSTAAFRSLTSPVDSTYIPPVNVT